MLLLSSTNTIWLVSCKEVKFLHLLMIQQSRTKSYYEEASRFRRAATVVHLQAKNITRFALNCMQYKDINRIPVTTQLFLFLILTRLSVVLFFPLVCLPALFGPSEAQNITNPHIKVPSKTFFSGLLTD